MKSLQFHPSTPPPIMTPRQFTSPIIRHHNIMTIQHRQFGIKLNCKEFLFARTRTSYTRLKPYSYLTFRPLVIRTHTTVTEAIVLLINRTSYYDYEFEYKALIVKLSCTFYWIS